MGFLTPKPVAVPVRLRVARARIHFLLPPCQSRAVGAGEKEHEDDGHNGEDYEEDEGPLPKLHQKFKVCGEVGIVVRSSLVVAITPRKMGSTITTAWSPIRVIS